MPTVLSPTPTYGSGTATGMVPGQLGLPDVYGDLSKVLPGLGGLNATLASDLQAGLSGELSPGTIRLLQDQNAAWAIGAGMPAITPGSLGNLRLARNLGLTSEDLKKEAMTQYGSLIPTISRTQTVSPELQNLIAELNALNLAAPSPPAAQSYAEQLFKKYQQMLAGAGGVGSPLGFSLGLPPSAGRAQFGEPGVFAGGPTQPWYESTNWWDRGAGTGGTTGAGDFSQAQWLSSIGWNPTSTAIPGVAGGGAGTSITGGPITSEDFDFFYPESASGGPTTGNVYGPGPGTSDFSSSADEWLWRTGNVPTGPVSADDWLWNLGYIPEGLEP